MQARVLWTLGDPPLQIAACRIVVDTRQRPASHQPIDLREELGPWGETRLALKDVRHFVRSEEHTSELQSQSNLVCRLLLEKKKKTNAHTCDEATALR